MVDEIEQLKEILAPNPDSYYSVPDLLDVGDELEGFKVVDLVEGEDRRWTRLCAVIIKSPTDRFYRYYYDKGLTENQDDEYYVDTVDEVQAVERVTTTVVWVKA